MDPLTPHPHQPPRRAVVSRRALLGTAAIAAAVTACGPSTGTTPVGAPVPGALLPTPPLPGDQLDPAVGGEAAIDMTDPGIVTAAWVVAENAKQGSADWVIRTVQRPHGIEGYCDTTSARVGDPVQLFVSTEETSFTVEVWRMGWYGGTGGLKYDTWGPVEGVKQPIPAPAGPTRTVVCDWTPSVSFTVPATWPTGVYVLKLVGATDQQRWVPLTVRDDRSRSTYLVQNSVTTWQAYNRWGGTSLYGGENGAFETRARTVSFDRPIDSSWGYGIADLAGAELPMVHVLERMGADVSYWTDIDLHTRPEQLAQHTALISLGHDEYWSSTMYDSALQARSTGLNIAFFGANACYRHIRLEPSASGVPNRLQVCYKSSREDPVGGAEATADWPHGSPPRPQHDLVGALYVSYPVDAGMVVSDSWLWAGAGVPVGTALTSAVGSEYDQATPGVVGFQQSLDILAHSPLVCRGSAGHSDATWFTTPGGGGVFASGTNAWIGKISSITGDPSNVAGHAIAGVTEPLTRATLNVLAVVGRGPAHAHTPSSGTWRQVYGTKDSDTVAPDAGTGGAGAVPGTPAKA